MERKPQREHIAQWKRCPRVQGTCLAKLALVSLAAALLGTGTSPAQSGTLGPVTVDLGGPGWTFKTNLEAKAHSIAVPHCWPADPKYSDFVGDAVYERDFTAPTDGPDTIVRLHFDAVYYQARVWLNGKWLGEHEGGYTPFEFDITHQLQPGQNHLLLDVDNTPRINTIPGLATARPSISVANLTAPAGSADRDTVVGWWMYGGIDRAVRLLITHPVYLQNVKVEAVPDLVRGQAGLTVHAWLRNGSDVPRSFSLTGDFAGLSVRARPGKLRSGAGTEIVWHGTLKNPHLWSLRDPYLYTVRLQVPGDAFVTHIGIREVRVRGTELLLNGKVVHLFGANRVSEDPAAGLIEPAAVIERDLGDMLADNMRMMRIAHYPQAPTLLDYADSHGMLIIAEAGNWNMGAWQMDDPGIRRLWQQQMREMMERDWNHPSIIAWSVGNEYESATSSGLRWTRDMRAFTLGIDWSRLITFASRFTFDPAVHTGTEEGSQYSDFVCINAYGKYPEHLDRAHALWPDKPIFVTEFGRMGEAGLHDPERSTEIETAVTAMRTRPWVIGGALWTWADYRSRFPGTPSDGIRRWGVVTFDRQHRDSWAVTQKLFASELP
jgi:beta-glucuronidase